MECCLLAVADGGVYRCESSEKPASRPKMGTNLLEELKFHSFSFRYSAFAVDASNDFRDTVQ